MTVTEYATIAGLPRANGRDPAEQKALVNRARRALAVCRARDHRAGRRAGRRGPQADLRRVGRCIMTQAQIRIQIRESRRAQGLPETVTDGRVLDRLAAEVLEGGGRDGR